MSQKLLAVTPTSPLVRLVYGSIRVEVEIQSFRLRTPPGKSREFAHGRVLRLPSAPPSLLGKASFYKYLSERMHLFADEILKNDEIKFDAIDESSADGKKMLDAIKEESVGRLGYFLKPSELFHKIAEKGARKESNFILEGLGAILKHIEGSTMGHDSEEDFEGLFEDLDLGSSKLGKSENQKNELIAKVLVHLDQIDFRLDDTEADVLGDAYEYVIGQFASGAGKKAGEFYTPQQVSTILAKIVTTGKTSLKNVYDPTCGSGSLLLRVAKEVEEVGGFYGQEMNPTTYNLARMNMILHGDHYQRFDLKNEDTLEHPAPEHADLRFEAIVANPPLLKPFSAMDCSIAGFGKGQKSIVRSCFGH